VKKNVFGLAVAVFLIAACQSNVCHLRGEAHNVPDSTVLYLTSVFSGYHLLDSMIVSDGLFAHDITLQNTDTALFCRMTHAKSSEACVFFFVEPGNVYVELRPEIGGSRVSGTKINNQWQALNDTVATYDYRLRNLISTVNVDSVNTQKLYQETQHLYTLLNSRINETATRNRNNALGRFISTHYSNIPH